MVAQQEQATLDSLRQEKQEITESLQCLNDRINDLSEISYSAESGQELAYAASARSALLRDRSKTEELHADCDKQDRCATGALQNSRYRAAPGRTS